MFQLLHPFFKKPTIRRVALNDLEAAEYLLLKERAAAEYHAKMTEYYEGVVARLSSYVNKD